MSTAVVRDARMPPGLRQPLDRGIFHRPSPQVKEATLVRLDHPEYVSRSQYHFSEHFPRREEAAKKVTADLGLAQQLGRFGEHMEIVTRAWLGKFFTLGEERGILFTLHRSRRPDSKRCLEIDALAEAAGRPEILFELKCSFRNNFWTQAEAQLTTRAEIVARMNPHVRCASVLVSCHPYRTSPPGVLRVGEHLELDTARLRESLREYQIPRICVPAASLIDFAKRLGQPFPAELLAAYQSKLDEVHLVQAQRTTLRTLARGAD